MGGGSRMYIMKARLKVRAYMAGPESSRRGHFLPVQPAPWFTTSSQSEPGILKTLIKTNPEQYNPSFQSLRAS